MTSNVKEILTISFSHSREFLASWSSSLIDLLGDFLGVALGDVLGVSMGDAVRHKV